MPPIERALLRTVPWLLGGLVASLPLLFVSTGDSPLGWFIVQLTVLVAIGLGLSVALLGFGDEPWFVTMPWSPSIRSISSGVCLVILVTGTVGLITLASSAALACVARSVNIVPIETGLSSVVPGTIGRST